MATQTVVRLALCRPSHPLKEAQPASVAASTQGDVDMQAGESSAESASATPSVPQVQNPPKTDRFLGSTRRVQHLLSRLAAHMWAVITSVWVGGTLWVGRAPEPALCGLVACWMLGPVSDAHLEDTNIWNGGLSRLARAPDP